MRKISLLLISVGITLFAYGGFKILQTEIAQHNSLSEAKRVIKKTKNKYEDFMPTTGETVGILHIPKLKSDLPIVEGTDEDELEKGVGHYKGTAYPLEGEQIVLSGHRDTVFRKMGELKLGDILTIQLPYGEFTYEIVDTKIVDANDRTIIQPQKKEVLTVTTCYPFTFIGNAPDRYIITALPVKNSP